MAWPDPGAVGLGQARDGFQKANGHGNETWLVLLGVCLWAGFPLAFGTILPREVDGGVRCYPFRVSTLSVLVNTLRRRVRA
jgi:hypothetical protein